MARSGLLLLLLQIVAASRQNAASSEEARIDEDMELFQAPHGKSEFAVLNTTLVSSLLELHERVQQLNQGFVNLHEKVQFRVGDEVKVTDATIGWKERYLGKLATIIQISPPWYKLDGIGEGFFMRNELGLLLPEDTNADGSGVPVDCGADDLMKTHPNLDTISDCMMHILGTTHIPGTMSKANAGLVTTEVRRCLPGQSMQPQSPTGIWHESSATAVASCGTIPKVLWQFSENKSLSNETAIQRATWLALNPDWEYRFLDNPAAQSFMLQSFDLDTNRAYTALPTAAMRADMLRYALLLKYGGVFVDMQCTTARPLSTWLPEHLRDGNFPVSIEPAMNNGANHFLSQRALVAPPNHTFHRRALENLVMLVKSVGFNSTMLAEHKDPLFQQFTTGAGLWTKSVADSLGIVDHPFSGPSIMEHCSGGCMGAKFLQGSEPFAWATGRGEAAPSWAMGEGSFFMTTPL